MLKRRPILSERQFGCGTRSWRTLTAAETRTESQIYPVQRREGRAKADMYRESDYQREVPGPDGQEKDWRSPFSRDYGRIIHSSSFRRQQGKTQVFPSHESDFFRNRLTHSLEVAQIAEGIAERLNHEHRKELGGDGISGRLCAAAGLIHDIGHPPFGHNGERALDAKMLEFGGFEGNAQTFRILTRLEKKRLYDEPLNDDNRAGFNLCHRTLAATLKYDRQIPRERSSGEKVVKGYYFSEKEIVDRVKNSVLQGYKLGPGEPFKSLECSIMDLADDIAYSVYDLEDCLKVGFLTPAGILASDDGLLSEVAEAVGRQLKRDVSEAEVLAVFVEIFSGMIGDAVPATSGGPLVQFIEAYRASQQLCEDGYRRTRFSSQLVHEFITGVELKHNSACPALSSVRLPDELHLKVEVLKQYTFVAAIYTARVKMGEYRGSDLVGDIFDALMRDKGDLLMPADVRARFLDVDKKEQGVRARIVCDFVAGMTDRYAMEFWARLKSDGAESMFKPI